MLEPATSQNRPLISVVMPVYNTEAYVGAALESLLAQTYSPLEILVVDDGSTDRSPAIIAEYERRDSRIRSLSSARFGKSAALNAGISAATGEYIALLDSDDLALPERFAVQLDWMRRAGVDLCGSCAKYFGKKNAILWFPEDHAATCVEMLFRCALLPSTVLARASVLKENLHAEEMTEGGEDYELWTRLAPLYRLGNVPRILVKYRIHEKQISVIKEVEVSKAVRRNRYRYFFTLFPDATANDYNLVSSIVDARSLSTLAELEQAGSWLVRLAADIPDTFLHTRMALRWMTTCRKSAHLGLACFDLHQAIAPQLGARTLLSERVLWLLCAGRIGSASRLMVFLKRLKSKCRRVSHAPA